MTRRFAIYAAPGVRSTEPGSADTASADTADAVGTALSQRAEQWLGRSVTGRPVTPAAPSGWRRPEVDAITVDARRYGFHGTLKPPFRLAEGRTADELDAAVARFAAGRPAAAARSLSLARLGQGGFYALVPGEADPALSTLADDVVTAFDDFRAPPAEAELARRRRAALTPRQRELLDAWGYPYVLDEFRFHLTLTDRIPPPDRARVEQALRGWFAGSLGRDLPVAALAIFAEAEPGAPFLLHTIHPLQPTPDQASTAVNEGAR